MKAWGAHSQAAIRQKCQIFYEKFLRVILHNRIHRFNGEIPSYMGMGCLPGHMPEPAV